MFMREHGPRVSRPRVKKQTVESEIMEWANNPNSNINRPSFEDLETSVGKCQGCVKQAALFESFCRACSTWPPGCHEGGVMQRILGYEAIGNNHGVSTIAHLACGHSRRFEYGYRSPSGTALCWDCPKETGPQFDIYGNRINPDGSLWNLDGKLAARKPAGTG